MINLLGFMQIAFERKVKEQIFITEMDITCIESEIIDTDEHILYLEREIENLKEYRRTDMDNLVFCKELLKEQEFIFYTRTGRFPD